MQQDACGLENDKAELISEILAGRARLEQMEANLAAAVVEHAALSAARDEANSEAHTLNRRIDAIRSRAATAEKLLSEARHSLAARAEEVRIAERKTAEATIARNTTQKLVALGERITEMEADSAAYRIKTERRIEDLNERLACERTDFAGARDVSDAKTMELELERTTLMERCNSLAESLKARESALGAAEQEIKSLTGHIRGIELEVAAYRGQAERHIEELIASARAPPPPAMRWTQSLGNWNSHVPR